MLVDGPGLDADVAKSDGAADAGERARQFRLRLERDHAPLADPARQPIDETALVGADVADGIARPDVPPDDRELGPLVAEPRLQRADAETEAFGHQPGLRDGHRSAFRSGYSSRSGSTLVRLRSRGA